MEYIAKYASKSEKISNVVKETFTLVVQNLNGTEDIKNFVHKLMTKSAGERDFSAQEVMDYIMSSKSVSSSFNVISLTLEGSRKISIKNNDVETEQSTLNHYTRQSTFQGFNNNILQCNLLNFVATYSVAKNGIKKRPKEVIFRTFPNVYSDC